MQDYYHGMSLENYLSDPAPTPSLSTSTADALLRRSPLHAWTEHPRLGKRRGEITSRGEIGSAAHALSFGGAPITYVSKVTKRSGKEKGLEFTPTDWATQDAKDARDEIRAAGGIPLLEFQRAQVEGVANAVKQALGAGISEVSMLWQTEGSWCRGRADFLDDALDVDLKTVDNADPYDWLRTVPSRAALNTQAGLRSLGHKALGHERKMVWLLVELEYPHAWSFVGLAPSRIALAERSVIRAAKIWTRCLAENNWPGYRKDIHWADASPWDEREAAERESLCTNT